MFYQMDPGSTAPSAEHMQLLFICFIEIDFWFHCGFHISCTECRTLLLYCMWHLLDVHCNISPLDTWKPPKGISVYWKLLQCVWGRHLPLMKCRSAAAAAVAVAALVANWAIKQLLWRSRRVAGTFDSLNTPSYYKGGAGIACERGSTTYTVQLLYGWLN